MSVDQAGISLGEETFQALWRNRKIITVCKPSPDGCQFLADVMLDGSPSPGLQFLATFDASRFAYAAYSLLRRLRGVGFARPTPSDGCECFAVVMLDEGNRLT
ncbi:MAG: hypothetical protein NT133_07850 [Alphaproteobacteria bacterium]|nr:hypothetical protein [Alphaproteobacteria bacterium]